MDVTAWGRHQAGNDAPIALPVFAKLKRPPACEEIIRTVRPEGASVARKRPSERYRDSGLTEVFPIGCSVPRAAIVRGQGIFEQYSFGLCVSVKDGSAVKYRRLICGNEVEPLTREGG